MPQLRERGTDLLQFANLFLRQAIKELERHIEGFTPKATELLFHYDWPGNLRELKNAVIRATLLTIVTHITDTELSASMNTPTTTASLRLHDRNTEYERISAALKATGGNKSKAAMLLGIDRKTLYNKLKDPEKT